MKKFEIFQSEIRNEDRRSDCYHYGGCKCPEFLRHVNLTKVTTPLICFEKKFEEFLKLDRTGIVIPEVYWAIVLTFMQNMLDRNFFVTVEKNWHRALWVDSSVLPEHDLVMPIYERLRLAT